MLRLVLGLLLDYGWDELAAVLQAMRATDGSLQAQEVVAFAAENLAAVQHQVGPLLDRLVSAAGGASEEALRDLFWSDLGSPGELEGVIRQLVDRALLEHDRYHQRVIMHPVVRRYMAENAVMLGEEWDRRHAAYYVHFVQRYQSLPIDRWDEVDVEWGNIYKGADWCLGHVTRLWQQDPLEMVANPALDQGALATPLEDPAFVHDMQLARTYALALAHYAFWRHPLGILRWLATGTVAALALASMRDYAWLLMHIGRQLFFIGEVERAIEWLKRGVVIFDQRDLLAEMAYAYTDLGTSLRILDEPRQALRYFRAAFECVAQLGDPQGLATAYMNLGSAYYSMDDYEHALEENRKALRIATRVGNSHLMASAFNNMGLAVEGLDRYGEAIQAYQQALAIFRRANDIVGISTCYNNLGSASYANQDHEQAVAWYELDLALSAQRGNWTDMAATLHNLGHVALEQNAPDRALGYFTQSHELYAAFQLTDYMREEQEMIEYIRSLSPAAAGARKA
jgi:tetratricopeptide (TPR) repeat protein